LARFVCGTNLSSLVPAALSLSVSKLSVINAIRAHATR
jgi:hypothetical protein